MEQAKNWEDVKPITDVNWLGCLLSSNLKRYKLGDIAEIIISSVDKKTKDGEQKVRLCNFVDVYHNWAITKSMHNSFMIASAKEKDIELVITTGRPLKSAITFSRELRSF